MKSLNFTNTTLSAVLALLVFSACGSSSNKVTVEALTSQQQGDNRWGMTGTDGKAVFTDEFENAPSSVMNGVFTVNEDEGVSVYRPASSPRLVPGLEGLYDAGMYTEGLIPVVRQDSRIEMVDIDGKTKFTLDPVDGHEILTVNSFYNGGVAQIQLDNDKVGAIDTKGDVVIAPIWDTIYWFSEGFALANRDDEREGAFYIIDNRGKEICRLASSLHPQAYTFRHGMIAGYKGKSEDAIHGFINTKGEFARVDGDISAISEWTESYFTYMSKEHEGKCGIMAMNGEVLVNPRYDNILMLGDDMFVAGKGSDVKVIINLKGEEIKRLRGEVSTLIAYDLEQFDCKVKLINNFDNKYFMLDNHGERINSEPMSNLAFYIPSLSVSSRYVDIKGTAEAFIRPLSPEGYNSYTLGSAMSSYCSDNADDYTNSRALDCGDTTYGSFTIHTEIRSDKDITRDTTPTAMYYTWAFNPNSRVTEIEITLKSDREINGLEDAVKDALRDAGWTLNGDSATKGGTRVVVDEDDNNISLTITRR